MRPAYWAAFSCPFDGGSPPNVFARRTKSQDKKDACMKRQRRKSVYLTFIADLLKGWRITSSMVTLNPTTCGHFKTDHFGGLPAFYRIAAHLAELHGARQ